MSDGFEYWFTEWDLNGNRWTLNPLANDDAQLDADGDSYDCDRDGEIEANERYTNVREFEARYWGRQDRLLFTFPSGTTFVGFGEDGLNAIVDGGSTPFSARAQMVDAFIRASPTGAERIAVINTFDPRAFNTTLFGISDPTSGGLRWRRHARWVGVLLRFLDEVRHRGPLVDEPAQSTGWCL